MNTNIVILSACANSEEADRIAKALVGERLAACVQILPKMSSVYHWQDSVESADEHLLLIKTSQARFHAIETRILEMHSYAVPEVIALPITKGWGKYLQWLGAVVHE